jgi:dienelactone hydrolase
LILATLALGACGGGGGAVDRATSPSTSPPASRPAPPATPLPTTTTATAPPVVDRRTGVGVRHETFVDPTRPTSTGESTRTFPVTIWYPAPGDPDAPAVPDAPPERSVGPYPLVVFVHGFAVTPEFYEELLRRWAAAGYVVAAAAYPGGDDDYGLQFTDTTFLITQLLQLAGGAPGSDPLVGTVDPQRVGVTGHSNGEAIAYGMGFLECCRDTRVKAVIALAGILGNINNPVQHNNGVPILHIMGEAVGVAHRRLARTAVPESVLGALRRRGRDHHRLPRRRAEEPSREARRDRRLRRGQLEPVRPRTLIS